MSTTPTLADVIEGALEARLESVFTSMPGRVLSFDKDTCTASIQPLVKHAYTSEAGVRTAVDYPVLQGVPVMFHGNQTNGITYPMRKGDTVLVLITSCALDQWKRSAGDKAIDPENDRRHMLSDAVAITGLRNAKRALLDTAAEIDEDDDATVVFGPVVKLGGMTGTEPVTRASDVQAAIIGCLTNAAVKAGVAAAVGDGGSSFATAVNAYFVTNPVTGSDIVEAQ